MTERPSGMMAPPGPMTAAPRTAGTTKPLRTWALGCGSPVLICGISGKGPAYTDGDQRGHYGGGSGVFWPDGEFRQYRQRGMYVVDIEQCTLTERKLPKPLLA
jgi:hypothetical protein